MKLLRTNMIYELDLESERDLNFDSTYLIFTKENGGKWWKIYNGEFVEVVKDNIQAPLFKAGVVVFNNETIKNILYGITFLEIPRIVITLNESSTSLPYTVNKTTTGFTLKVRVPYTGSIEWSTIRI